MFPPKKWLTTGTRRTSVRCREATSGASTRAPYSPVSTATGACGSIVSGCRRPGGPVSGGGGPVHRGEEAGAHAEGGGLVAPEGSGEGTGHPDAVLVLGEPLVGDGVGKGSVGHQVVLVGGEDHAPADGGEERLLPAGHRVAHGRRLLPGVGPHPLSVREPAYPERDTGHGGQGRIAVEHTGQRVLQHRSVVLVGAHHDLPVHLDSSVEKGTQPSQAGRPPSIAKKVGPDVGIGGVDGDEQRTQPLGQHPLEVHFGEPGEGGEVAVEEGQAIVVVLEGQAAPHAARQLMDETELAVVVAGPDPVENSRTDLGPQRLTGLLFDLQGDRVGQAGPADHQVELALVHQEAVLDDVAG